MRKSKGAANINTGLKFYTLVKNTQKQTTSDISFSFFKKKGLAKKAFFPLYVFGIIYLMLLILCPASDGHVYYKTCWILIFYHSEGLWMFTHLIGQQIVSPFTSSAMQIRLAE